MKIDRILNWRLAAILSLTLFAAACDKQEEATSQGASNAEPSSAKEPNAPETTRGNTQARPATRKAVEAPRKVAETPKQPTTPMPKKVADMPTPDATSNRPVPLKIRQAPKAPATPPEIVKDPSTLDMEKGFPLPKPGDKIYVWNSLPMDACGEYWVKGSNGKVSRITVCRDEH